MLAFVVIIVYALLCAGVCVWIKNKRYVKSESNVLADVFGKQNQKFMILTGVATGIILIVSGMWHFSMESVYTPLLLRWLTIFFGCYICAFIDYKEMLIPNRILLLLLIVRCAYLVYECIINYGYWKMVFGYPLLGAFIGGFVFVLAKLIAKGGVGMGDIKMFIVIGFYVGSAEIMPVLLYTCICMASVSLILLLFRKATLKDSLPMAPFAFLGVFIRMGMHMLGSMS